MVPDLAQVELVEHMVPDLAQVARMALACW